MLCRTESVRTRALQTAIQTEDEFLEYARAFHRTTTTEAPQTTLGSHAIKEETPVPAPGGGLVGGHGTQYASS